MDLYLDFTTIDVTVTVTAAPHVTWQTVIGARLFVSQVAYSGFD